MTNPAWVVLFTKIAGLVTDTGGTTSHPAVLAREFGIPAVIGTSVATHRIKTGDRHQDRRDGGAVEILRDAPAESAAGAGRSDRSLRARDGRRPSALPQRPGRPGQGPAPRGHPQRPYPPDSRIVETQVARELGTSQAPVREALRGLEALGVVEITPFRGARVRRPSRGARSSRPTPSDRPSSRSRARLAVPAHDRRRPRGARPVTSTRCAPAARNDDGHGVAEADARFHARIVELADNGTLERVWRSLEPFSRTYITLVVPGRIRSGRPTSTPRSSRRFERRDADAVVAALERHFEEVSENMARRWPDDELPEHPA